MKRFTAVITAASLLLAAQTGIFAAAADESVGDTDISDYTDNEVFVMYTDGSCEVKTYADSDALAAGLDALAEDDSVTLFQPNYKYESTALSTNDELLSRQWALSNDGSFYMEEEKNEYPVYDNPFETPQMPGDWHAPNERRGRGFWGFASKSGTDGTGVSAVSGVDINLDDAWSVYDGGKRAVTVAIVDTGIDYTNTELADGIWTNTDEIAGNGIDDDGNGYIDDVYGWNFYDNSNQVYTDESDDSHGTHGAGTIIAKANNGTGIAGIVQSDNVKIMSVKALGGSEGSGSTESIIKAIKYAEDNGALICNLSLGTSENDTALYKAMADSDMLFVVAAGNDGADTDSSPSYPASYDLDNIISVANMNYDGNLHYSSNYGKTSVDLAAPGTYILSTTPEDTYSYMTGTSMAAPMVTAAAAMVYSYYDGITLADVKDLLLDNVKQMSSLSDITVTGGMLDLGAAMTADTSGLSGRTWDNPEVTLPDSTEKIQRPQQGDMPRQMMPWFGWEEFLNSFFGDSFGSGFFDDFFRMMP